ncbi:hypothetical protein RJ55_07529 [Drechmeria coniospora]|nr:hypothetical protein RJ55_07529 [Drechmeria coniospora]
MRLLSTTSLRLELFPGDVVPEYTVLSHRWEDDEVTFEHVESGTARGRRGFPKMKSSARQAREGEHGTGHIWIDTCCIDKSSSAELSEAINSMFRWYQRATRCLVYLSDVVSVDELAESRWFTRGWTLQELIAPKEVRFFNKHWEHLGDKKSLGRRLSFITGIGEDVLLGADLDAVPVCRKLSWAANRATTRPEDMAYCLMGLLRVNMALLYGEGAERAFKRLQEEFIRESEDETVFAWTADRDEVDGKPYWGMLAPSAGYFRRSANLTIPRFKVPRQGQPTTVTNRGLRTTLLLRSLETDGPQTLFVAPLNCSRSDRDDEGDGDPPEAFTITLQKLSDFESQYARVRPDMVLPIGDADASGHGGEPHMSTVFVRSTPRESDPVAGFCVHGRRDVAFTFVAGSPRGPVAVQGHVVATFGGGGGVDDDDDDDNDDEDDEDDDASIRPSPPMRRYCFLDIPPAEVDAKVGGFHVRNLRRRRVVGSLVMKFTAHLDDRPPPSNRILPTSSYRDPHLVVGLEPAPRNQLGTPSGFVRPWYTFSDGGDQEALEGFASGTTAPRRQHRAPGGASIQVGFSAVTIRSRTYYEVELINATDQSTTASRA